MIFGEKCVRESQTSTNFGFTLLNSYRFLYENIRQMIGNQGKLVPCVFVRDIFFYVFATFGT